MSFAGAHPFQYLRWTTRSTSALRPHPMTATKVPGPLRTTRALRVQTATGQTAASRETKQQKAAESTTLPLSTTRLQLMGSLKSRTHSPTSQRAGQRSLLMARVPRMKSRTTAMSPSFFALPIYAVFLPSPRLTKVPFTSGFHLATDLTPFTNVRGGEAQDSKWTNTKEHRDLGRRS